MGMGMSSMSSDAREHMQKEIADVKAIINNEIKGLRTDIKNDNAETYAELLKAVDDKIAIINKKMSMQPQMKDIPPLIDDLTEPLREELRKLKDSNSNLQQNEITDKEALSKLNNHIDEIQRKFDHHVTHADVKELEARVAKLEARTAPTRGMGPATLPQDTHEDAYDESAPTRGMSPAKLDGVSESEASSERSTDSAAIIRDARGAKEPRRNFSHRNNRRSSVLETIRENSQANKNPYLLRLE